MARNVQTTGFSNTTAHTSAFSSLIRNKQVSATVDCVTVVRNFIEALVLGSHKCKTSENCQRAMTGFAVFYA